MAWHNELIDLCRTIKNRYGWSDKITFGDMPLRRSQVGELERLTVGRFPELKPLSGSFSFYGDDTIEINPEVLPTVSASVRGFVWDRDDPMIGAEVEFMQWLGNEIVWSIHMSVWTNGEPDDEFSEPRISSNTYLCRFAETGYDGHGGAVVQLTEEQALEIIRYIKSVYESREG